ncbi:MAG: metallophosphoesterase, partial [Oscillospiraceae bacterium]|nr:metallophosphoesterase [Oscillospiraceae bacterium]
VVQLSDGYRLFALNDDTNKNGKSGFSDECFEWITAEAERARRDGQMIIAMTHHPLIAPSPIYAMIGKGDMLGDYEARIEQLADIGVSFIFTGHTHIHNISDHCSKRGNRLYDICTGSPIGYPGVMRTVTFADDVDITTDYVSEPQSFRDKGIKLHDALGQQLIGIIRRMIEVAATDVDRLADMAVSISIKPKLVYKFGWIIKPIFKFLNSLKVSTVARWTKKETGLKKEDYADIKDVKVVDIITELVLNLYGGESKYPPETPVYKITVGMLHIIDSILGILHIDMKKITKVAGSATELIEPLLYNTNIDSYTAKLPIPRYYPQGEQGEIVEKPATSETVKKSKKGLPLIIAAALILIVFLPVWLLLILIGFLSNSVKYRDKLK